VAVGAGNAGAKGDGTVIVDGGAVVASGAMAQGATATTGVACGAADQAEVGGTVAEVAVILMDIGNYIQGACWIVAGGTGRGRGHVAACLVILLHILRVVGWSIAAMAGLAINFVIGLAQENLGLEIFVVGVMTGRTGNGAA